MEVTGNVTGDLSALDGGGEVSRPNDSGYVTLDVDDHYFVLGGARGATIEGVQIVTDGAIAGTFTIETCNLPRDPIQGDTAITDYNETSGNWVKEDPAGAYVASVGTGWTWTLLTGVKTAGVGGAMIHLGNLGARRVRLRAAITTGGKVRVNSAAKAG